MAEVLAFRARAGDLNESAKKRGRQLLAKWLRHGDAKIEQGLLIDFDGRVARAFTKFPSSVLEGHFWAGQPRLAQAVCRSVRSLQRSVARFERNGLLFAKQRGAGQTARYVFCIDWVP